MKLALHILDKKMLKSQAEVWETEKNRLENGIDFKVISFFNMIAILIYTVRLCYILQFFTTIVICVNNLLFRILCKLYPNSRMYTFYSLL